MVQRYTHFRIRESKGCKEIRTKEVGRPGHTKLRLCLLKPRKGEKPARGRKYESETQSIMVQRGTPTFKRDIQRAKRLAGEACKKKGKMLVKVGQDYKCK